MRYTHDCENCVYLGDSEAYDDMVDLYIHIRPSGGWAVARFGNGESQYYAMRLSVTKVPYVAEAIERFAKLTM